MPTLHRLCPSCGDERAFEAPPCADGHGADCPGLACLDCGSAVLVDPPLAAAADTRPAPVRPAGHPVIGAAA